MEKNNPKRRKKKDNPYKIFMIEGMYYISFEDINGKIETVEVNEDIYSVFNDGELEDISEMNEFDRHIEHSKQDEATLYWKTQLHRTDLEDLIVERIQNQKIQNEILKLPRKQQERILLYYWEGLNCKEIGDIQGCSKQAVSLSIRRAKTRLKITLAHVIIDKK